VRPASDIRRAQALLDAGLPLAAIAAEVGVARATIRAWRAAGFDQLIATRTSGYPGLGGDGPGRLDVGPPGSHPCTAADLAARDAAAYAYLFGQYLGDGTISRGPRDVYRLRLFCCAHYPGIVARCVATARAVLPRKVGAHRLKNQNVVVVLSHWKHMCCLFPQHGPGRKHERAIVLDDWQDEIVLAHPESFLRGLVESDGCRSVNRVNGGEYPRYLFSNRSEDVRALFVRSVEQLGLGWTTANRWTVAVSRRADVAVLDGFIGPKW